MEKYGKERLLEIFFRALRGEDLSVKRLAEEYGVSTKSISRSVSEIRCFLSDHRDLVGNTELSYFYRDKCYRLYMDEFLSEKEMFALTEVLIGTRAFSAAELTAFIGKLRRLTSAADREKLNRLIAKEMKSYVPVAHDCESVEDSLLRLVDYIEAQKEITIDYYRMDRTKVSHRIYPASLMFSDHYFYLIAFRCDIPDKPVYFRVDRIVSVRVHRESAAGKNYPKFDEGELRRKSLLMFPGKLRTVRFEFSGPSLQAVLDKFPTARVIARNGKTATVEAEVYGDGIRMWLLSQGSWVKVLAPAEFREEMLCEIEKMKRLYSDCSD